MGRRIWKVLLEGQRTQLKTMKSPGGHRALDGKAWCLSGCIWGVLPEGRKSLEVDGLQDMFGCIELQQQHDEDAMVGQLLELSLPHVMVLYQHSYHDTQHLKTTTRPSVNSTST